MPPPHLVPGRAACMLQRVPQRQGVQCCAPRALCVCVAPARSPLQARTLTPRVARPACTVALPALLAMSCVVGSVCVAARALRPCDAARSRCSTQHAAGHSTQRAGRAQASPAHRAEACQRVRLAGLFVLLGPAGPAGRHSPGHLRARRRAVRAAPACTSLAANTCGGNDVGNGGCRECCRERTGGGRTAVLAVTRCACCKLAEPSLPLLLLNNTRHTAQPGLARIGFLKQLLATREHLWHSSWMHAHASIHPAAALHTAQAHL